MTRRRAGTARTVALVIAAFALVAGACGSSSGSSGYKEPVGAPLQTISVQSGNLFFKPDKFTVPQPGIYELKLTNTQSGEHTLVFGSKVPGFRLDVVGEGSTQQLKINLAKGKYTFWCDLPGHRAAGMQGTITVQ
ncbi:MAG: cupredoxin domain-containing protein [Actinobacteria bacterium]|nr:cupredoxin domain-containing protein [Actinomycetota bacterium]